MIRITTLALGALCALSRGAFAYVRATDDNDTPLRWEGTSCIVVRASSAGCADIGDGSERRALAEAARGWEQAVAPCSYIRFVVGEPSSPPAVGGDGQVTAEWVNAGWSELPAHLPEHIALTAVWSRDGVIYDADIEINDEHHAFSTTGDPEKLDLQTTLTHELGHVLGLDELCYLGTLPPDPRPADHLGRPIPACGSATEEVRAAAMYPTSKPGETHRRAPAADDVAGVCAIYPLPDDPGRCAAEEGCGCHVAEAGGSMPAGPAVLVFMLLRRWRRKRHQLSPTAS